ncbi:MAG: hypothetical protein KatS3mg027_1135 [Bacteroidia bacterium]|nr:MAG: hypothetical protein KatS3mg027_1135 [Bacteroidia bacterium]
MKVNKLSLFYVLSFVEGGMMFTTELASTRKISVFFGSSLYVWIIVLSITLVGLAVGYYWANNRIEKNKLNKDYPDAKVLSKLFLYLSIALLIWKFNNSIALWLINSGFELITAVCVDALILVAFPMFLFGAMTTYFVALGQKIQSNLPVYGKILAFSTFGSVVFAVISVLLFFPKIGVQNTILSFSVLSLLLSALLFKVKWWSVAVMVIGILIPEKNIRVNVLYKNDGAFSNLMVVEQYKTRYLLVNYIIQSFKDYANDKTLEYAELMDSVAKIQQWKNKDVLILGLGGGILANVLEKYSRSITGIEIDPRIIDCAKKYFDLNPRVNAICDDAQWWIQKDMNKYDVIIMDLFNGEEPPAYLLTKENFERIKNKLIKKDGILIINWYGYYTGEIGRGTRILLNTLSSAGFSVSALSTNLYQDRSNLVIYASLDKNTLPINKIEIQKEDEINTADKNILSLLNADVNYQWRKGYLNFIQNWWN